MTSSTVIHQPTTRRWTRVEYERLIELGVFQPGERLELIDGLLVVREPQGSRHASAIRRVLAALHRALGDAWQIDSQLPVALDADSEPEPDVAVVPRDSGAYRDAHPTRAVLIVEVAESSYQVDRDDQHGPGRSEEHTSELQSRSDLVCRLLLEKKKDNINRRLRTRIRRD